MLDILPGEKTNADDTLYDDDLLEVGVFVDASLTHRTSAYMRIVMSGYWKGNYTASPLNGIGLHRMRYIASFLNKCEVAD